MCVGGHCGEHLLNEQPDSGFPKYKGRTCPKQGHHGHRLLKGVWRGKEGQPGVTVWVASLLASC